MSDAVLRVLAALRHHGYEPIRAGGGWSCRCPAHDDQNPSLSIDAGGDGRALVNCHAGCSVDAVCAAIGVRLAELFGESRDASPRTPRPELFARAAEAVAELERRHGPRSSLWTYRDAAGEPVGVVVRWDGPGGKSIRPAARSAAGKGWSIGGMPAPRPLYCLPELIATPKASMVFVCEGEKAADAARAIGLPATTSPHGSKSASKADWSPLAGRGVVVLPDHDEPGERYARDVLRLATAAGAESVRVLRLIELWPEAPEGGDMADLLLHRGGDAEPLRAEILRRAESTAPAIVRPPATSVDVRRDDDASGGSSQAEQVVRLAMELFTLGQTAKGEPFAVRRDGPNVAIPLQGAGGSMKDLLAREYRRRHERVMCASAYTDAVATLRGEAMEAGIQTPALRVGADGERIVLDLGTDDGRAVIVDRKGWSVCDRSPVLFTRTALTGPLPEPESGGNLEHLREVLNVTAESWPILLGWLIAAMMPDIPHPILMLGGQHGTGKTTAARFLCGLFDPSDAPTRSQPRDPETWAMCAANGWTTTVDNISSIPDWWSDALCKCVTGDGWLRRTLYTNNEVSVLSFRRVVVLTSIDAGSLRGDLGERLVLVDLEPIPPTARRTERELDTAYSKARPLVLGALLETLSRVLAVYDSVSTKELPRMADFARVLAALDSVAGTRALPLYAEQGDRIAGEVIEADPVGEALVTWMSEHPTWSGSAGALLAAIRPSNAAHGWPKSGKGMGGRLRRLAPALAATGLRVTPPPPTDRTRTFVLERIAPKAQPPESGVDARAAADSGRAIAPAMLAEGAGNGPPGNRGGGGANAHPGRSGDPGGSPRVGDREGAGLRDEDPWGEV